MQVIELRSLRLHTLDRLCADLIRAKEVDGGEYNAPFSLSSPSARSVLNWYFEHRAKWTGWVMGGRCPRPIDSTRTEMTIDISRRHHKRACEA